MVDRHPRVRSQFMGLLYSLLYGWSLTGRPGMA